jgi:hypothetical protein
MSGAKPFAYPSKSEVCFWQSEGEPHRTLKERMRGLARRRRGSSRRQAQVPGLALSPSEGGAVVVFPSRCKRPAKFARPDDVGARH